MKKLQVILKDFVEQINDLLGPYVPDEEETQDETDIFEDTPQSSYRTPTQMPPPSRFQAPGAGMRGLSKVPSKTVQRRPMMKPRADPGLSPIPHATQQPRRTFEQMPPQIRVTPPTRPHMKAPQPRVLNKNLLSPIPKNKQQPRRTPEQVQPPTNQTQPQAVKSPATKGRSKPQSPLTLDYNRIARKFNPNRTAPAAPRRRVTSPFSRSFDSSPKYLKEGMNKTLKYKPTRVDVVKKIDVLDLVQQLAHLEERVQRATNPTYRPMSSGSPGRDNMPFNRTYARVADTSFQAAGNQDAVAENEPADSEGDEVPETDADESPEGEPDSTLVKLYLTRLNEKWEAIEEQFCKSKLPSLSLKRVLANF